MWGIWLTYEQVEDLETRLSAERKQQKSANNELDDLLQQKAISIEELNTQVLSNILTVKSAANSLVSRFPLPLQYFYT